MTKVFLCAYQPEFEKIVEYYQPSLIQAKYSNGLQIYYFFKQQCFLVVTGIGLVNAAISCQKVIDLFYLQQKIVVNADYTYVHNPQKKLNLINLGFAGAIGSEIKIGDVFMIDQAAYHDFDLTIFGHNKGQVPDSSPVFIMKKQPFRKNDWQIANCFSFDCFVNQKTKINNHHQWSKVVFDMEAAALGQTVEKNDHWPLELTMIKIISDCIDDDNNHQKLDYQVVKPLSIRLLEIFQEIVDKEI